MVLLVEAQRNNVSVLPMTKAVRDRPRPKTGISHANTSRYPGERTNIVAMVSTG
jgi:hypothetical protein